MDSLAPLENESYNIYSPHHTECVRLFHRSSNKSQPYESLFLTESNDSVRVVSPLFNGVSLHCTEKPGVSKVFSMITWIGVSLTEGVSALDGVSSSFPTGCTGDGLGICRVAGSQP